MKKRKLEKFDVYLKQPLFYKFTVEINHWGRGVTVDNLTILLRAFFQSVNIHGEVTGPYQQPDDFTVYK